MEYLLAVLSQHKLRLSLPRFAHCTALAFAMLSRALRSGAARRLSQFSFSTEAAKPYRVLGLQQVAVGGPDKARLATLWRDYFGLCLQKSFVSEKENVDEDVLLLGKYVFMDFCGGSRRRLS
eukprot:scaffold407_cov251-Pinguiococcus_pyrenoidosus.AAC.32